MTNRKDSPRRVASRVKTNVPKRRKTLSAPENVSSSAAKQEYFLGRSITVTSITSQLRVH